MKKKPTVDEILSMWEVNSIDSMDLRLLVHIAICEMDKFYEKNESEK